VSISPTNDNALIVALVVAPTTISPGGAYTAIALPSATKEGEYDLDAGSAGSKTVDFSSSGSGAWELLVAAFNAAPPGSEGDADVTLPQLTVYADTGESLGAGDFSLPQFTVFAQDQNNFALPLLAVTGAGSTGETASGAALLPMFTVAGVGVPGNSAVVTLPALSVEATGISGPAATAEVSLPQFTVAATGDNEVLASAAVTLPQFVVLADGGAGAETSLPSLSVAASGETGWVARADLNLPVFETTGVGGTVGVGAAAATLPRLGTTAHGLTGETGSAAVAIRAFRVEADGQVGTTASGAISLPRFTSSAAGSSPSVGTAAFELPSFYVEAVGSSALANNWRTWVLNLHTRALSEYTGFQFNSYARFAGHTLGASSGGVFKLDTTKSDAGTPIEGLVRTGVHDYDVSWLKRVPRLYVNYSAEGDMEVRTITSEDGRRRYLLPHNNVTGIQQRRVPVGRGPKSRYWQYEIANRDGADFALSSFIVYPIALRRRSQ